MPSSWNKGLTKETHPSVLQISQTMRKRKLDNFKKWRDEMKRLGKIRSSYPELEKDGDLAELIGVVLGDGHIEKFPRTECLTISANAHNAGFIKRYADLVEKIFEKNPYVKKVKSVNCTKIRIYQKEISSRLAIPSGDRGKCKMRTPGWIWKNTKYLIRYLRGLYEAEGSFCVHKPTSTYKFLFSNRNESLLANVFKGMRKLGFHPHVSSHQVQISRKVEAYASKKLLEFRSY